MFGEEVFTPGGTGYNMHPHHNFIIMAFVARGTLTHINTIGKVDELVRGDEPLAYHLKRAPRWQHAGFLAAFVTGLALLVLQVLAETQGFFNPYLAAGYGRFKNALVHYSQAGLVNGLLLTFDLLLLGLFACALLVRLFGRASPVMLVFSGRLRSLGIPLMLAGALGLGLASLIAGLFSLALGGLLCATLCAALWAER